LEEGEADPAIVLRPILRLNPDGARISTKISATTKARPLTLREDSRAAPLASYARRTAPNVTRLRHPECTQPPSCSSCFSVSSAPTKVAGLTRNLRSRFLEKAGPFPAKVRCREHEEVVQPPLYVPGRFVDPRKCVVWARAEGRTE